MKALSKERGRRYDSAIRFAEDVQRYLTNDMVEARPPSMGYQLKKFYQRNRSLAVSALIAFILLSSCLIVVTAIGFQLAKKTKELKQKNEQLLSQQHQLELAREEADQLRHPAPRHLVTAMGGTGRQCDECGVQR